RGPRAPHVARAPVLARGRLPAIDGKVADRMTDARTVVQPSLDELRAEAMAWGRKPRRRGALYVADHVVHAMRAYVWTIIVGALGQPILYLVGLVVGLASLIGGSVTDAWGQHVPYLVFVAPALLMTAGIQVASEEFSYPIMDGFK